MIEPAAYAQAGGIAAVSVAAFKTLEVIISKVQRRGDSGDTEIKTGIDGISKTLERVSSSLDSVSRNQAKTSAVLDTLVNMLR